MNSASRICLRLVATAMTAWADGSTLAQTTPAAEPPKAEAKAPEPDYTLTGNFGIYSQYIFRGLTQTDTRPAAQG
ncbi:MAG TPA: TorF family putative porin, partial [Casimicrobiaceae bacterium]|nr:TorF family putative porin [Casimicrobiaceae bacterium]